MDLNIDPDVKSVAEFMQSNFAAARLIGIADGVARLAPILWGQYRAEEVSALWLQSSPISSYDPHTQLNASGSSPAEHCVGDGFAAAGAVSH